MSLTTDLKDRAYELGFCSVGVTAAQPFDETRAITQARIAEGLMDGLPWFTSERVARACDPQRLLPGSRSLVSLAMSYIDADEPAGEAAEEPLGLVARYALGFDYHEVLQSKLRELLAFLEGRLGWRPSARIFVDHGPLVDRAVAHRAGVGWFGKNTNILTRGGGSWVFLSAILTDVELEYDQPLRTSCGSCRRCLDACPTGALQPYVLDNRRCISFLTIELRGPIPRRLRPLMGAWVFGCDLCQDVCPVNRKAQPTPLAEFREGVVATRAVPLLPLLELDEEGFRRHFRASPIKRAKLPGLQRNVCVALGNLGDPAAIPALGRSLERNPYPLVRGHAAWALGRFQSEEARQALLTARRCEADQSVLEEIELALAAA